MSSEATEALRADETLGPVVAEHGPLTLEPAPDLFERLVVSIVRQQVSIASADAIRGRLFDRFEVTPEAIGAAEREALTEVGLSASKAEYVQNAAEAFLERGYDRAYFEDHTDEEVVADLTDIRGVGSWTAKMFLMFCLGREDVFPVEDLGVRKGMWQVCEAEMDRAEMRVAARRWAPYRSYASLYLWRAYEA